MGTRIIIDPEIFFGRSIIENTGIATELIAERFKAGESIKALAKGYDLKKELIELAIRFELKKQNKE